MLAIVLASLVAGACNAHLALYNTYSGPSRWAAQLVDAGDYEPVM